MKTRVMQDEPERPEGKTHVDLASAQMQRAMNVAARMGAWSASHWKTAVFGWIAFVVAAFAIGLAVGTKNIDAKDANVGQSHKADRILQKAFPQADPQTEIVLVQNTARTADDPAFRATVADVVRAVSANPAIKNLRSPYESGHADLISKDRHTALVEFDMRGEKKAAEKKIDPIVAATEAVAKGHSGFYVGEAGSISSGKALDKLFKDQLKLAGERSIPITILVLLLVLGTLVAVGVPLLLALSGVLATIGLIALPSQLIPMDENVSAVVLLIGLAVGVDYSLFYIKREREERAAGKDHSAALAAAAATSGRSVLISGFTVLTAMAGLFFAGDKTYLSFGIATMLVVGIAMLGSLTVLPALLSKLGGRIEKGRIPYLHRLRNDSGESRFWRAILTPALRHPLLSAAAAVGLLVVLAIPVLGIHTAQSGFDALPKSAPTIGTVNRIQDAFSDGHIDPAIVAIEANTDSSATKQAITALGMKALASGQMTEPIDVEISASHSVARVTIPLVGKGVDDKANAALRTLREDVLPATIGKVPGASYAVTGGTAISVDQNSLLKRKAPIVFGFVLVFAFLLLLVAFRSIVIALKAIALNLLSVGAAFGVLVAVFQYGWGESLLNFQSNGGIAYWLPIFLFVILFGLSMDYHVFILSRVREAYDRGLKTEDAVAHGIATTAGVVSSAAIVMVGVFAVFALMPILDMKEMGIGLAAAVLIDATIVRAVLLPATMKLLGDSNWYLPKWLEWLPRLDPGEPEVDHDKPTPPDVPLTPPVPVA
jgi:RND superfamily putative drug exporter